MSLPTRKIASNLLWQRGELVRNPLLTLDATGAVCTVATCEEPDRQPATEFYAGLLVLEFPTDYHAAFAALQQDARSLPETLAELPAGACVVVLSGLDYATLRLTSESRITKI